MPLYEYRCRRCGRRQLVIIGSHQHVEPLRPPLLHGFA